MTALIPFNSENIYDRIKKIQLPDMEPITDGDGIKRFLDNYETDSIVAALNREAELSPGNNLIVVDPILTHKRGGQTGGNVWANKN